MSKKKTAYHHGDLKAAMIKAALKLVREKGPRGFTLNEASRAAGVSKSAPYKHFKDKDALLVEIAVIGNRMIEAHVRDAAEQGGTAREKMLALFVAYIDFAKKHPDYFAVMFQSGIDKSPYPQIKQAATSAFGVAVELAAQIETTPESAQALSLGVWTMAHGFAMLMAEGNFTRASDWKISEETARKLAERFLLRP